MMSGDDKKPLDYGSGFGGTLNGGVNYDTPPAEASESVTSGTADASGQSSLLDLGIDASTAEPPRDITTAEFMTVVIEGSKETPVLVDFWAPWCGPCKQLTPVLEAAVAKSGGKVKLVKMNIDEHPQIPGQMGIQSIPAVIAFMDGKPVDAFMGVKTEAEITKFIEKLAGDSGPSQLDQILEEAALLMEKGEYREAGQIYNAVLQQMPDNVDAVAGLGNALFKLGKIDEAKQVLANIENPDDFPQLKGLASAIELEEQAGDLGNIADLEAKISANEKDHQARFDLAVALNGKGRREEAAEHLLQIIKTDRKWQDDGARQQLLKFFEAWGPMDEATVAARRKLSSMLFS